MAISESSLAGTPGHCEGGNEYNGDLGLRISSIFVILLGSLLGTWFLVFLSSRNMNEGRIGKLFFFSKYFGSGVIIATAFIHLLAPAHEALSNPCLTGPITEYAWVEGIILITIFILFIVEFMAMRQSEKAEQTGTQAAQEAQGAQQAQGAQGDQGTQSLLPLATVSKNQPNASAFTDGATKTATNEEGTGSSNGNGGNGTGTQNPTHMPFKDHLGHAHNHAEHQNVEAGLGPHHTNLAESYSAQMVAIFVLEFGIIFHSIFIGLTLAVAGEEFNTLYIVLVFHQTFEGMGLGARLSTVPWPANRRWTPYLLAVAYAFSTPLAIAAGLGVRYTYQPGSQTALLLNGVFDSISAGILIYTGLVEFMAHEFMFSRVMKNASLKTVCMAFLWMVLGAGLMALLGKWA